MVKTLRAAAKKVSPSRDGRKKQLLGINISGATIQVIKACS